MSSSDNDPSVPKGNGKEQPWKTVYPPANEGLTGVVETKGQMLLLDGTGGSGTVAVPNVVTLPPKPKKEEGEKEAQEKGKDEKEKEKEKKEKEKEKEKEEEKKEKEEGKKKESGKS